VPPFAASSLNPRRAFHRIAANITREKILISLANYH
jgi:hypothetical protein